MKIVFISHVFTPHQIPLCDEWDRMENVTFTFIEAANIDKSTLPIGWRTDSTRDYVVDFTTYRSNYAHYQQKIDDADAVIIGSVHVDNVKSRLEKGGMTFIYSERIYKNIKQILRMPYHLIKFNRLYGGFKNLYLLCASAFSAYDYNRINCFRDKSFKWGYFTSVSSQKDLIFNSLSSDTGVLSFMWCSRFLDWKHPELPVKMAANLKKKGYKFHLDMYGSGDEIESIKLLIQTLKVHDVVSIKGEMPNTDIIDAMRKHDIFLFTSDQNEGWGAVANEAMSNGCTLVASSKIGSVPFLIEHRSNGCIFESENLVSLIEQVEWLITNPSKRRELALNAYYTLHNVWSPRIAAVRFVHLVGELTAGKETPYLLGPCSVANILKNNWFKKYDNQNI